MNIEVVKKVTRALQNYINKPKTMLSIKEDKNGYAFAYKSIKEYHLFRILSQELGMRPPTYESYGTKLNRKTIPLKEEICHIKLVLGTAKHFL